MLFHPNDTAEENDYGIPGIPRCNLGGSVAPYYYESGYSGYSGHKVVPPFYHHYPQSERNEQTEQPIEQSVVPKTHISWEEFFMGVCQLSAQRSKDPNTKVGACIVNENGIIVATGYNGFPRGIDDSSLPWTKSSDNELETKYPYVVHAEANAIMNSSSNTNLNGNIMYVSLFPCNECAKLIIQSGIKKVVYLEDRYPEKVSTIASKKLLQLAGIRFEQFTGTVS